MADLTEPRIFTVKKILEVKVKARNSEEAAWYGELLLSPSRRLDSPIDMYLVGSLLTQIVVEETTDEC